VTAPTRELVAQTIHDHTCLCNGLDVFPRPRDYAAADALMPLIRAARVQELRETADAMHGGQHVCFRPQGCVECGRQKERDGRERWLRDRADRIESEGK